MNMHRAGGKFCKHIFARLKTVLEQISCNIDMQYLIYHNVFIERELGWLYIVYCIMLPPQYLIFIYQFSYDSIPYLQ